MKYSANVMVWPFIICIKKSIMKLGSLNKLNLTIFTETIEIHSHSPYSVSTQRTFTSFNFKYTF